MKKNYLALILVLVLALFCFAACDTPDVPDNPGNNDGPGTNIPDPDVSTHTCENVCPDCGKCLDTSCTEDVCEDKCEGHKPAEPKLYTISWVVNGKTTTEQYKEGQVPSFSGSTDKPADKQYTYTFSGWSPSVSTVSGNTVYVAQYVQLDRSYTVTWSVNGKSTQQSYKYGEVPRYPLATPTKPSDTNYDYAFSNWDKSVTAVTGDVTYTAVFSKTEIAKYRITWVVDGKKTYTNVAHGQIPKYSLGTPVKDSPQYAFEFLGWAMSDSPNSSVWPLEPATSDMTYYAKFKQTTKEYTVTWKVPSSASSSYNDRTLTSTEAYGNTPTWPETALPTRNGYHFMGWKTEDASYGVTDQLPNVTGNVTYEAVWVTTGKVYASFSIGGNVVYMATDIYATSGSHSVVYSNLKLVRRTDGGSTYYEYLDPTNKILYRVTGFRSSVTGQVTELTTGDTQTFPVTDNVSYTAVATANYYSSNTYSVRWMLNSNSIIDFAYGLNTNSAIVAPVPQAGSQFFPTTIPTVTGGTRSFLGWSLSPTATTADFTTTFPIANVDRTYYAVYSQPTTTYFTITWNVSGNTTLTPCAFGQRPAYTGSTPTLTGYTFLGWSATPNGTVLTTIPLATANATYYAVFNNGTGGGGTPSTPTVYTVKFHDKDGNLLTGGSVQVAAGYKPQSVPTAPTVSGYEFVGWATTQNGTPLTDLPVVNANTSYYAVYKSNTTVVYTFIIKSNTGNDLPNSVTSEKVGGYAPIINIPNPSSYRIGSTLYKFSHWTISGEGRQYSTSELASCSYDSNRTITAHYDPVTVYKVEFIANNGVVQSGYVEDDNDIIKPATDPKKATDENFYYTFAGWKIEGTDDSAIITNFGTAVDDVTYVAVFTPHSGVVTVKWFNGVNPIQSSFYAPGDSVIAPANPAPTDPTLEFKGWAESYGSDVVVTPDTTASASKSYYAVFAPIA